MCDAVLWRFYCDGDDGIAESTPTETTPRETNPIENTLVETASTVIWHFDYEYLYNFIIVSMPGSAPEITRRKNIIFWFFKRFPKAIPSYWFQKTPPLNRLSARWNLFKLSSQRV